MDQECEMLVRCGFFKKYELSKDLVCKGFIQMYCRGARMGSCKRKEYRRIKGTPPMDDMMPSGQLIITG